MTVTMIDTILVKLQASLSIHLSDNVLYTYFNYVCFQMSGLSGEGFCQINAIPLVLNNEYYYFFNVTNTLK